jgi:hypothetical protein
MLGKYPSYEAEDTRCPWNTTDALAKCIGNISKVKQTEIEKANEITAMRADMRTHLKCPVQIVHDTSTIQVKQPHQQQHTDLQRDLFTAKIPAATNKTELLSRSATPCCRCRSMGWKSIIRVRDSKLLLRHCKFMCEDCPVHRRSTYSSETAMWYQKRVSLLPGIIEFAFLLKWTSGFPSLGISLRAEARVKVLPLYRFFRRLYGARLRQPKIHPNTSTRFQSYSREPVSKAKQDYLFSVARKMLLQAYQSRNASPQDIDAQGWTLLHVRAHLVSS